VAGDDPNRGLTNEEFLTRGDLSAKLLDDKLVPSAYISYARHSLTDRNTPDTASADLLDSAFNGDLVTFGGQSKWLPSEWISTVVGAETQAERADSWYRSDGAFGAYQDELYGEQARTNSFFGEGRLAHDNKLYLDAGVRHDVHSIFGDRTTFKVAPAVIVVEGTKLRGSVGTGFKAPSLVQLYSSYGNPELKAETSTAWDLGVDQDILKDKVSASLSLFRNDYDQLITFNPESFVLENIQSSHTQGAELSSSVQFSDTFSTRLAYTYTDTENDNTGESLLRRPRNKNSLTLLYTPGERFRAQAQWRLYSGRFDNDFTAYPPARVSLAGYGVVDIAASYKLNDTYELFGRVDNLFDQEYQEVLGFGTMGAAAYLGVRAGL
jgi:vitamin B12 transporter